jgi:hypothetical protein
MSEVLGMLHHRESVRYDPEGWFEDYAFENE